MPTTYLKPLSTVRSLVVPVNHRSMTMTYRPDVFVKEAKEVETKGRIEQEAIPALLDQSLTAWELAGPFTYGSTRIPPRKPVPKRLETIAALTHNQQWALYYAIKADLNSIRG